METGGKLSKEVFNLPAPLSASAILLIYCRMNDLLHV